MDVQEKPDRDYAAEPFCLEGMEPEQRKKLCEDLFDGTNFTA